MDNTPSQTFVKFIVRLPEDLRERIRAAAERSGRSMNAEILQVLEHEYPAPKRDKKISLEDSRQLQSLIAQLAEASTDNGGFWKLKRQIDEIMEKYQEHSDFYPKGLLKKS